MANTSPSKAEQIGNYRRRYLNGRFYWIANDNKYIDGEVQVGNWILKPDGTKVHVTARQANTQVTNTQPTVNKQDQHFDGYYIFPNPQDPNNLITSQETLQPKNTDRVKRRITQRRPNYTTKVAPKGQAYWDGQYQNFLSQMTDEQKKWLELRGIDYTSAEKMQTYLNNHGQNLGKWGSDNKWGNASQAAWDNFVATTMKNNPLQTTIEDQPMIDAPDPFGYKTSNTYEDNDFASKLKGMGIKSNADLINFMYNSAKEGWKGNAWQTQFRNDVDKALGGDYSDANIRKTFNTKNDWGRGFLGRGDFSDFQNALQTNAGVWNGIYEQKQNNTRMDAARQQYANKLAQQYTPQLSKLSLNKPMIGSTGTNTLGNIGIGLLEEDWVKHAQQTGYFPTE